jgi:hypothetical protein
VAKKKVKAKKDLNNSAMSAGGLFIPVRWDCPNGAKKKTAASIKTDVFTRI